MGLAGLPRESMGEDSCANTKMKSKAIAPRKRRNNPGIPARSIDRKMPTATLNRCVFMATEVISFHPRFGQMLLLCLQGSLLA